ncbi:MAG TPA: Nif3-like dinuclear metal center hexameric protein [Tissierellia bacterium]|nr:Nif3-like dinuclear metal center hexameric protein [Tissierellia bacterium]
MRAIDIVNIMNKWALPNLIDEWDNTGFQIGDPNKEVSKVLVSLDLDREVLDKAIEEDVQMIITHHPLIFKPIKSIVYDSYKEKLIYDIIKNDMVVYNAHTNLDLAKNGVNDILADMFGLSSIEPLKEVKEDGLFKLVVFVPKSHADIIRNVLGEEGAGFIGNYSHCTFNIEGIGTFMPHEGTSPFIGEANKLEKVEEIRIETIVKKKDLNRIVKRMISAHPYEEVAYDIYPLFNKGEVYGYGRVGNIERIALGKFLNIVKEKLEVKNIIVYGEINRDVTRIALCGGSGASFIYDAYNKGAQVYITGDIKYHDAQYANELGLTLIDAGHYHTEKVILPAIGKYLENETYNSVHVKVYYNMSLKCVIY